MIENDNIIIKEYEGLKYLQFKKLLDYGIKHAYTLKSDGFDFSHGVPEEKRSYEVLNKALEIDDKIILKPFQTHTDNILCVDENTENLNDVDALITNKSGIALTSKNADCILFLFYDPIKKVIANVHSGWRGTFKKIAEKTIKKMITYYGSNPKDIICCICPSIRQCHFEVDADVKELCEDIFGFTNQLNNFIKFGEIKEGKQKFLIDTVKINKILFKNLGLKENNIIDCEICSVCNKDIIHSVRVEGISYKRSTAIIVL